MSFGIYPWLFLIPPLLIAGAVLASFLFSRTELGKQRARYVRAKYGIVTGKEAEAERARLAAQREKPAGEPETETEDGAAADGGDAPKGQAPPT